MEYDLKVLRMECNNHTHTKYSQGHVQLTMIIHSLSPPSVRVETQLHDRTRILGHTQEKNYLVVKMGRLWLLLKWGNSSNFVCLS